MKTMQAGEFKVSAHNHGFFRLDGGAMFGSVPKPLWSREAPPDEENRILLATRSLVIETSGRKVMIDTGCGDKGNEKFRSIFAIEDRPNEPVLGVTDVLLTHLHFDHAGGISRHKGGGPEIEPCYPAARHYVSKSNFDNARSPNVRERASYLKENWSTFELVDTRFTSDEEDILPGITVHEVNGHTRGLQWIKLVTGDITFAYPADLIPTSAHLPVPYVMGYDICAETALAEKAKFLEQAVAERWVVVFEHDPEVAAARITFDERGRPVVDERIEL